MTPNLRIFSTNINVIICLISLFVHINALAKPADNSSKIKKTNSTHLVKSSVNNMVFVEGGTFTMGSSHEQAYDFEQPPHKKQISSFYMAKTEVTQALWLEVMGWNYSYFPCQNCPVNNISWANISQFIKRLNKQTKMQFRLPTEAEWEYAAKGGNKSQHYLFSGSNTIRDVAWFAENSNRTIHPVATKKANEIGLYDMTGNVWEFCQDDMSKNAYKQATQKNEAFDIGAPQQAQTLKVLRGSGYEFSANESYVFRRDGASSNVRLPDVGFRLALTTLTKQVKPNKKEP